MTSVAETPAPAPTDAPRTRRSRTPFVVAGVAAMIVAALIVTTAVWFVHWRSSLHELSAYPEAGAELPVPSGTTWYFGATVVSARAGEPHAPRSLSTTIASIRPVVLENTAGATISVVRCVLSRSGPGPLGVDRTQAVSTCSALTAFRSGRVTVGNDKGDDDIVIAITPRHAGRVHVAGADVRYSSGLRHGRQHVGFDATLTTTR